MEGSGLNLGSGLSPPMAPIIAARLSIIGLPVEGGGGAEEEEEDG